MNIVFVAPEYYPFINSTSRGYGTARLADEFVSMGHDVSAVVPFPNGENLDAYSLARRLVPISVEVDGQPVKAVRYDGRTSTGVTVHFLEFQGFRVQATGGAWLPKQIEAFGRAGAVLIDSFQTRPDVCISFDKEASCIPALLNGAGDEKDRPAHVLVITDGSSQGTELSRGIESADRVVFEDPSVEQRILKTGHDALEKMLDQGHAVSLGKPPFCASEREEFDKISAKTEFQVKHDLPVRGDIPLVCFPKPLTAPFDQALEKLLKSEVQVVAHRTGGKFTALGERYSDRLALVSEDEIEGSAMTASDSCVVGDDADFATKALLAASVPIAGPLASGNLVELEPSCQSGSGILVNEITFETLVDAFGRLFAAFVCGNDYYKLLGRLPGFVPSWQEIAGHYIQLIESIDLG